MFFKNLIRRTIAISIIVESDENPFIVSHLQRSHYGFNSIFEEQKQKNVFVMIVNSLIPFQLNNLETKLSSISSIFKRGQLV